MGTLHNVYQIKPLTINGGALIKIRDKSVIFFRENYKKYIQDNFDYFFPHNTVLQQDSVDLEIFGQNQEDRIIAGLQKGDYLLIQSGSSRGFEDNFVHFISEFSDNFDDCLFYVIWATIIQKYHLENGALSYEREKNFKNGFISYIEEKYGSDFQIISDIYLEEITSAKNFYDSLLTSGEDPNDFIDTDDFSQYLEWMKQIINCNKKSELEIWINSNLK